MRLDGIFKLALVALIISASPFAVSQVVPAARENGLPLSVGAGGSSYDVDWGHGRMEGATVWVDAGLCNRSSILCGLGIEAEARDISFGRSPSQPSNFRLQTAGGGVIYTIQQFRGFRPYGKYLVDFGGIDWNNPNPHFRHETRTVSAAGLGVEFRAFQSVWIRADYEYQFWPDIDLLAKGTHVLDPQGFTVGAMYDFRHRRRR